MYAMFLTPKRHSVLENLVLQRNEVSKLKLMEKNYEKYGFEISCKICLEVNMVEIFIQIMIFTYRQILK